MPETRYWLVGAARGGSDDRTDELVSQGVWRFWPDPKDPGKYRDQILSMQPGDGIAIKAAYTKKNNLPFETHGHVASVMAIKAVGTVRDNPGDGETISVDWHETFDPPREWYFYTARQSVWRPKVEESWRAKALIDFVFHDAEQDIARFRNEPYWRDRFGDADASDSQFGWTAFYQEFASKLLEFRGRRGELVEQINELVNGGHVPNLAYLRERGPDGSIKLMQDICPFTLMGAFNRGATVENRRSVAAALARIVGVGRDVPESFTGIPVLNNQASWFHASSDKRESSDIDNLWELFRAAVAYADAENDSNGTGTDLADRITTVLAQRGAAWNLTMGMYWIRPWDFVPLDENSRRYIAEILGVSLPNDYHQMTGTGYLKVVDTLLELFDSDETVVNSFPELSLAAWSEGGRDAEKPELGGDPLSEKETYSLSHIQQEGSFFPDHELERMLDRLDARKNLILQGPPGTGKTWLSKRLAYALIGARDAEQVVPLQFHPTMSYEDFVRGWRPGADGRLQLVDGPLMEAVAAAHAERNKRWVLVIEEINRGNPAEILGEMLTLLEGDKRGPEHALRLSHMREGEHPVHLPPNLYVIGTMNIADRSLALVDLALRRRFAFFNLEPKFNDAWKQWLHDTAGVDPNVAEQIRSRMQQLNQVIADDEALGPQFQVGHSYVTPKTGARIEDPKKWFQDTVVTEIAPLLEEYWFDRPGQAREQAEQLLANW
ncbi:McrB family protein [Salinisphaera orenii]|uniref:McrB family protein n=1 Tax=Salinisphaera orenii TaxID=856731 RepID=UPI00195519B4